VDRGRSLSDRDREPAEGVLRSRALSKNPVAGSRKRLLYIVADRYGGQSVLCAGVMTAAIVTEEMLCVPILAGAGWRTRAVGCTVILPPGALGEDSQVTSVRRRTTDR
jgi:hypothetical protein